MTCAPFEINCQNMEISATSNCGLAATKFWKMVRRLNTDCLCQNMEDGATSNDPCAPLSKYGKAAPSLEHGIFLLFEFHSSGSRAFGKIWK